MDRLKELYEVFLNRTDDGTLVATSMKVTLTMVSALTMSVVLAFMVDNSYRDFQSARITTFAAALNPEPIRQVIDSDRPTDSDGYRYLLQQLRGMRQVNDDVYYAYMLRQDLSSIQYLADAEGPGNPGYSPPGKQYQSASPQLRSVFINDQTAVEGPVSRNGGLFLSAMAPIKGADGKVMAVVVAEVPAGEYFGQMVFAILMPLIFGGLFSAIFATGDHIRNRRRQAMQQRFELVSIASHEIRTPLTGVRWGEEILLKSQLTDTARRTIQAMYEATLRLQDSIEDILQLANWQSGRYDKMVREPTDITAMVAGIMATQQLPAAQRGITLEMTDNWPLAAMISCDAQRMKRVFNNLISNACKYSNQNSSIVIDYEKINDDHLISVIDHGIGIPEPEQTKVFEGFYRASNAISHEAGGTGMGLYMSRAVVERHGGRLWLTSRPGKGTTAYVRLP